MRAPGTDGAALVARALLSRRGLSHAARTDRRVPRRACACRPQQGTRTTRPKKWQHDTSRRGREVLQPASMRTSPPFLPSQRTINLPTVQMVRTSRYANTRLSEWMATNEATSPRWAGLVSLRAEGSTTLDRVRAPSGGESIARVSFDEALARLEASIANGVHAADAVLEAQDSHPLYSQEGAVPTLMSCAQSLRPHTPTLLHAYARRPHELATPPPAPPPVPRTPLAASPLRTAHAVHRADRAPHNTLTRTRARTRTCPTPLGPFNVEALAATLPPTAQRFTPRTPHPHTHIARRACMHRLIRA